MTNKLVDLLETEVGRRPLYMCHLIAGYPSLKASEDVARGLIAGGADILEIQIPFSDPMADGPSISVASRDALEAGATVRSSLALAKKVSRGDVPVVIMSYLNPVFTYGIDAFVKDAASAGVSALIMPDAPLDSNEGEALCAAAKRNDLCMIPVISPGVPRERLQRLARDASGFVYCTSRQGITGANSRFVSDLQSYMKLVREELAMPLGLGFGIQTRADAKRAAALADIVIAGSVFVNAIKAAKKGSLSKVLARAMHKLDGNMSRRRLDK